jgi:hypothetical protein
MRGAITLCVYRQSWFEHDSQQEAVMQQRKLHMVPELSCSMHSTVLEPGRVAQLSLRCARRADVVAVLFASCWFHSIAKSG